MFYDILTCGATDWWYEIVRGNWDSLVSWFKVTRASVDGVCYVLTGVSLISKASKDELEEGKLITHSWIGILGPVISSVHVITLCVWFVAVRLRSVGTRDWWFIRGILLLWLVKWKWILERLWWLGPLLANLHILRLWEFTCVLLWFSWSELSAKFLYNEVLKC